MAWENRNGNKYYYRKKRVGQRVFSIYCGNSNRASIAEKKDRINRGLRLKEKKEQDLHRDLINELIKVHHQIHECERLIEGITKASLLINGYHTHHRQWRKKR